MDQRSVAPVVLQNGLEVKVAPRSRNTSKGGWSSAIFIIFVEVAERFAYYGLVGNLIMYLMKELGQPMATAAENVNIWVGVSSIFPIIGAIIADSYLGRFKTILISSIIYLAGMVLLTFSVSVVPKHNQRAVFFTALYILAVGEGGHKPCVQTFAADQFDEELPEQKMAKSSFFNWWYMGIVAGATVGLFFVIYLQYFQILLEKAPPTLEMVMAYQKDNVGWTWGAGVLSAAVAIALAMFLIGTKKYRSHGPIGSPFTRVAQVLVAAARKRHLSSGPICYDDDYDLSGGGGGGGGGRASGRPRARSLARTTCLRFLDNAMVMDNVDASTKPRNPWRLCPLNQVEEVKLVLRLIPVWLSCLMFTVVQAQSHTFFTKQGSTMIGSIGTHFQIPAASLQGFLGLTILAAAITYDRFFVPLARRLTGHPSGITMLQRIGVGLSISILGMVLAGFIETKRVKTATEHGLRDNLKAVVPMQVWWLLPQYMICGVSDVFTIVGLQELFYDHVPEQMRSMGAAAYISVVGVGSFLSSGIIAIVQAITSRNGGHKWLGDNLNTSNLNYYYWVLAGMSGVNLCIYLCVASGFKYKKVEGDGEGVELGDKYSV